LLSVTQIDPIQTHQGQSEILESVTRFRVVACGRRWGKTEAGKIAALKMARKGGTVWWIMPSYAMAADVWRGLKLSLNGEWAEKREQERTIIMDSGGMLRVRSGDDPDSLRGSGLDLAVLDEAAFLRESVWTGAIRPALSDRRGQALFLSTPKGIGNWFWKVYGYGLDPNRAEWQAWTFPTSNNPHIPPDEIEAARDDLPERVFRQEYLAEFIEDSGGVFRNITPRAIVMPQTVPTSGHRIVFGLDWARVSDFTCIAIIDATTRQLVALDRFNGIGWALQRGRIAALAQVWKPSAIWAESNSIGSPNIEALQGEGLPIYPFTMTAASKDSLINGLALAFERDGDPLTIVPDPVLLHELQAYSVERLPSGRFRYGAPSGGHDDTVIATALAWYGAQYGGISIRFA
jgi:hypothetical protein